MKKLIGNVLKVVVAPVVCFGLTGFAVCGLVPAMIVAGVVMYVGATLAD